ncbi:MAG TPA: LysR family transcriptional regulator [Hyphomicrobiales bacterium]|nr:LysR family transcriptional regulator [Hyphomicrobiales bacterium]
MTSIADLEIFARVVTAGSMSAAGRELDLSPAVVSKRISHLEARLGTRLFHRTTRQLQLTETGRGFYERVVQVLATVQEAEAIISSGHERIGGALRITAPTAFSRLHIVPYLSKFLKQHPDLSLEIIATDQIMDIVREGIDIAVRISELDDSSLVAKKLAPCHRLFCASAEYLKEYGTPKTLADLSKHKMLVENNLAWRMQGPEGAASLKATSEIKTNSIEIVQQAAVAGCGIALCSTWQAREEILGKRLIPILPQYREAPGLAIYAVYPDKQYVPAKLRVFIEFLQAIYGQGTPYWDEGLEPVLSRAAHKKSAPKIEDVTAEA